LREATGTDIVTAFAHETGWKLIKEHVVNSSGPLRLLAGLSFVQTEPAVLRDWIGREMARRRAKAYLWTGRQTFHPKVFVLRRSKGAVALVGSGNLSAGGLRDNVECFYYVDERSHVGAIAAWITQLIAHKDCRTLSLKAIDEYEVLWKEARKKQRELNALDKRARAAAAEIQQAELKSWTQAVAAAKAFLKRDRGAAWAAHRKAASRIKRLLDYPRFHFTESDWNEFYDVWELGHLIPIWKHRVYRQRDQLVAGLRILADRSRPIAERVNALCDRESPNYVEGFGLNAATKILASIEPSKWPVENHPIRAARKSFGYSPPRGGSFGEKYAVFADTMQTFKAASGAKDMLELDGFFYEWWRRRQQRPPAK
jgi:hypothetical protein